MVDGTRTEPLRINALIAIGLLKNNLLFLFVIIKINQVENNGGKACLSIGDSLAICRDSPDSSRKSSISISHYAGTRSVSIDQIQGRLGRCADFDAHFHPLQERTRNRWLSVASALQNGVTLPPVELVQVGERYLVRDGHHRISVARALGQVDVDAEITIIDL